MSYVKIILHCVWSTKKRQPFLNERCLRENLFAHICANAKEKGIWVSIVGGYVDHVHLILFLGRDQVLSKVLQQLKGESSYWFNKRYARRLEWQDDYFAVSIGESQLPVVSNYILHQEEHHRRKSFQKEYEEFMSVYKFRQMGLKSK
ncbi:IS200/IS605 family transposase [Parabacteroides sp.]